MSFRDSSDYAIPSTYFVFLCLGFCYISYTQLIAEIDAINFVFLFSTFWQLSCLTFISNRINKGVSPKPTNLLKEHVDFLLKSFCRYKPSKNYVVEPQKMLRERKAVATKTLGILARRKALTVQTANRAHPPTVLTVQSITTPSPSLHVSYQISPKRPSVGSVVQSFHVARK